MSDIWYINIVRIVFTMIFILNIEKIYKLNFFNVKVLIYWNILLIKIKAALSLKLKMNIFQTTNVISY